MNVRSQGAIAGASVMNVTPHGRRLSRCALLAALCTYLKGYTSYFASKCTSFNAIMLHSTSPQSSALMILPLCLSACAYETLFAVIFVRSHN